MSFGWISVMGCRNDLIAAVSQRFILTMPKDLSTNMICLSLLMTLYLITVVIVYYSYRNKSEL